VTVPAKTGVTQSYGPLTEQIAYTGGPIVLGEQRDVGVSLKGQVNARRGDR